PRYRSCFQRRAQHQRLRVRPVRETTLSAELGAAHPQGVRSAAGGAKGLGMDLHRRSFWLGVPLVLWWAAGAGASPAQSAQESAPPVFRAEVALVAVPVFVTDKSGKAVRGLSAEDFEVYDGG